MRLRSAVVGGCETEVEIHGDKWVDWFDGFDLVLVLYGFDGLIGFDFLFHIGLIGLILDWWLLFWFWFPYFDLLF